MAIKLQLRRGLASLWTSTNPILAQGEKGYETDTGLFKMGDGTTAWNSLAYWADTTAIHDNVSAEISAITEKVTPVNADLVIIEDSAAANVKKRVQLGNLPGSGGTHNILSATHTDSLTASVVLGDLAHGNVTPKWARLAGNTTSTKKFLRQTGTGAVSAVPAWDTIVGSDIPADSINDTHIDWGTGANQVSLDDVPDGTSYEKVAAAELSSGIYKDATTSVKGIASFDSGNFAVTAGAVTIKTGGVGATELAATAVTPGAYTNTDLTVDADGRITLAANGSSGGTHNILSATHTDTLTASVVAGDIMIGNATPKWSRFAKGTANQMLGMDSTAATQEYKSIVGVADETDIAHSANEIRIGLVNPLIVTKGGTGLSATTINQILYSSAANTIAGLATGNSGVLVTGATGIPAIGTDIPTAVTIGTAYIYRASGTDVPLADGGTNASLTASNGGIVYSTASALAILAGTATANQVLLSGLSTTPAWSTAVYPATTTINQLLYSSAANTITGLATGNSGLLVTGATGIPSIATDIPTAVTIGSAYIYRVGGTDVNVANGGTGLSTIAAGSIWAANALDTITAITSTVGLTVLQNSAGTISWVATTGTGNNVFATSPTLVTPLLGTPTSGVLTNCTGLPIATGVSGLGANIATFLATPSSANLLAAITDETGTGSNVFATSPTLVTPNIGAATGTSLNVTGGGLTISTNGQTLTIPYGASSNIIYGNGAGMTLQTGVANQIAIALADPNTGTPECAYAFVSAPGGNSGIRFNYTTTAIDIVRAGAAVTTIYVNNGATSGLGLTTNYDAQGRCLLASGDNAAGLASNTTFTNAVNTTVTNTYLVRGGQAANTVNTAWLKIYIGTAVAWVPYWTNATP